jgi:hypothetical protein
MKVGSIPKSTLVGQGRRDWVDTGRRGYTGECQRMQGHAEPVASRVGNVQNMFQVIATHSVCRTTGLGIGER